jgi:hypothetical protein
VSFRKALLTCVAVVGLGGCFLALGAANWSDRSYALVEVVSGGVLFLVGAWMFVQVRR